MYSRLKSEPEEKPTRSREIFLPGLQSKQDALLAREEQLDAKEKELLARPPADPVLLQALSTSLVEGRSSLTHRWASLVEEQRLMAEQAKMALAAALNFRLAAPACQSMDCKDEEGLPVPVGVPSLGLPAMQTTWCAIWSVQQIQWVSLQQQQQQADMPCFSCCFQR